mmetsp:Transcript_41272/g.129295  ORF Transcript_41272/g.129295 Transcript_41272/m.129295 type:complete len:220 (+) Transcript_41272:127-786(+)
MAWASRSRRPKSAPRRLQGVFFLLTSSVHKTLLTFSFSDNDFEYIFILVLLFWYRPFVLLTNQGSGPSLTRAGAAATDRRALRLRRALRSRGGVHCEHPLARPTREERRHERRDVPHHVAVVDVVGRAAPAPLLAPPQAQCQGEGPPSPRQGGPPQLAQDRAVTAAPREGPVQLSPLEDGREVYAEEFAERQGRRLHEQERDGLRARIANMIIAEVQLL